MKVSLAKANLLSAMMLLLACTSAYCDSGADDSGSGNSGPGNSTNPPPISRSTEAMNMAESDSSNTACYFNDDGSISWKWGLKSDNGWYSFTGQWVTTPYTKLTKFSTTTTTYESIYNSCVNSKKYYDVDGELFAIFAATSGIGKNYSILLGGGDLFPNY